MTPETPSAKAGGNTRPRTRPRFELSSEHSPAVVIERLKRALRQSKTVVGSAFPGRIELTVPRRATHLWSPQLLVDVEAADGGSHLKARFAPHPHVWTLYVGACAIASMATFGALILATAQWMMETELWGLWIAPGTAIVALLTFGAAFVGQGLSAPQMFELRDFLREALGVTESEAELDGEADASPS
ncbi:MAG: hypothetical protein IPI67_05300 [Myxococcales bacterium]|nr:hypothetical protein [Myxococcales bacterium]